jgi:phosphopantothenoylcysteine decarboxylase/phosphopantothenate--cysteine ligase
VLKGKKILIGITGSIAAYKIPYLIRLLVKEGVEVQVVMTKNARDFVTPLTLSTLSKRPVFTYPFDEKDGTWNSHVDMGNWADLMIIAPASAATLSKMASGMADNLLVTTYLSAKCPVFFAPAMDLDMYRHPTTTRNVEILQSFGHQLIEPQVGELASGLCGAGRMEEPENMLEVIRDHFKKKLQFKGKKFLITAGPTYEYIDPVRFIGNFSSGQMGYELATEASRRGAEVTLVSGPTNLKIAHQDIRLINVVSALQMYDATMAAFPENQITIMSAAVADFTPEEIADKKIKKEDAFNAIRLVPTKDILASAGELKRADQILVGFALETDREIENAQKKLNNKNLDLIVLNSLNDQGAGFGVATNKITILDKAGNQVEYELKPKSEVASDILNKIAELI